MCETYGPFNSLPSKHGSATVSQAIAPFNLHPVDSLDVTIVVDNAIDILLPSDEITKRPPLTWDWSEKQQLIAEHGYSVLLTVHRNGEARSILYDAGLSQETAIHNMGVLGIDLKHVEAMVLSHGHADHHGGLEGMLRRIGRKKLPFILHPDAWRDRKIVFPTGTEIHMPPPDRKLLEDKEVQILEERGQTLLLDGSVLVSGQVERVTSFEKGFPLQQASATASGNRTRGYGMIKESFATSRGGDSWWFQAVAILELSMFCGMLNESLDSRRFTPLSEVFT